MKYNTIKYFCTTNGSGVRTAIFVSGCTLHCKGCFNQKAWDFNVGEELTTDVIDKILDSIDYPYIDGLSILGGEPMDTDNLNGVYNLVKMFRERFGDTKDIWMWSGHTMEEIQSNGLRRDILDMIDVLVDGRFRLDEHKNGLKFKGSENQRIWKRNGNKWNICIE